MGADETATSLELGITYRRLDYWARKGWLRVRSPGTGIDRKWPAAEKRVAALMGRLTAAGLKPAAAARVARSGGSCELAPGIRITVDGPQP